MTRTFTQQGTVAIEVTLRRTNDPRALAIVSASVEVAPLKQAWRLTSLTKVTEVGNVNPAFPSLYWESVADPEMRASYAQHYTMNRAMMTALLADPTPGVLYLGTFSGIQGFGIRRFPVGAPPNLAQAPEWALAYNAAFPAGWYSLSISGEDTSGSVDGTSRLSSISSLKLEDGVTLTGTFRIAEGGGINVPAPAHPVHYVDYSFTAVRVP